MSYFDSGVYECPFWQVELIRVVKVRVKTGMRADAAGAKIGCFVD